MLVIQRGEKENLDIRDENIESIDCEETKLKLKVLCYGSFPPGVQVYDSQLVFYFEFVSGLLENNVLYLFFEQGNVHVDGLNQLKLELETKETVCSSFWNDVKLVVQAVLNMVYQQYNQQYLQLAQWVEEKRGCLLVDNFQSVQSKEREFEKLKGKVEDFYQSLVLFSAEKMVAVAEDSTTEDILMLLENLDADLTRLSIKRSKYSRELEQEYLSFLSPFVFQRFFVALFTWNALVIECFHSNFFSIETIPGFVTLTVGLPVLSVVCVCLFGYFLKKRNLQLFVSQSFCDIGE
eukprot:jgi/Galph1/3906/GphlegSOOS_G2565.1